jgi:inner membrane protein
LEVDLCSIFATMDSLTQIVLGAAVGEVVYGKRVGVKAAFYGAIAGTIPDLDVFISILYDPIHAKLVHRGFSHSLLFSVIFAPLFGLIVHLLTKQRFEYKSWAWLMFWAMVTHPLLDIFTNYGTQFFWPFDWRISINSVFVIDPLYTVPFLILLIWSLCLKRTSSFRRKINWTGIVYSCLYLCWGVAVKLLLIDDAKNHFSSHQINATRIEVSPMPLTSFYWSYIAEDQQYYYLSNRSIFSKSADKEIDTIEKNKFLMENLVWQKAEHPTLIKHFTDNFYAVSLKGNKMTITDMRFGTIKQFSAGKEKSPIFTFGMNIEDRVVKSIDKRQRFAAFENLNLSYYWNKVFAKYE